MKKITVSLDDDAYQRVRAKATELGTSVSAMVNKYLMELTGTASDFESPKQLQDKQSARGRSFASKGRVRRDDVHERRTK